VTNQDAKPRVSPKTNQGLIVVEVDTVNAPKSAANFIDYGKSRHKDGTIYHRVINNLMIQRVSEVQLTTGRISQVRASPGTYLCRLRPTECSD